MTRKENMSSLPKSLYREFEPVYLSFHSLARACWVPIHLIYRFIKAACKVKSLKTPHRDRVLIGEESGKNRRGRSFIPNTQVSISPYRHRVYFVQYDDGTFSCLTPKLRAEDYADKFGGFVRKHSNARKWWEFWKPLIKELEKS